MATLYVTEFKSMGRGANGLEMQAPLAYPTVSQSKAFTGTAGVIDNAVSDETTLLYIITDAAAFIKLGGSPTATSADIAVAGEVPIWLAVEPNSGLKVSAVTRS